MSDENKIVEWRVREIGSEGFLPSDTKFVKREQTFTRNVKVPIYVMGKGVLKSESELADIGLEKKGYTQAMLDEEMCNSLYVVNPVLATRVRKYKVLLDELGLPYNASMDDIEAAAEAMEDRDRATEIVLKVVTNYDAIITNLEGCGSDQPHMAAYELIAKLIKYLPSEESVPSVELPEEEENEPVPLEG